MEDDGGPLAVAFLALPLAVVAVVDDEPDPWSAAAVPSATVELDPSASTELDVDVGAVVELAPVRSASWSPPEPPPARATTPVTRARATMAAASPATSCRWRSSRAIHRSRIRTTLRNGGLTLRGSGATVGSSTRQPKGGLSMHLRRTTLERSPPGR